MPRLSADARLVQVFQQAEDGWKRESLTLRLVEGFESFVELQPIVSKFLSRCNGTRTLSDVVDFAAKVNTPSEELQRECLKVVRKLIERGSLLC